MISSRLCKLKADGAGRPRHAGYQHSGRCAAWAYKSLDLSKAKRVFILGPSHTYGFLSCAITTYDKWATPFGELTVDTEMLNEVQEAADMDEMPTFNDKQEHSMEMQAPYLYLRMKQTFDSPEEFPKIVPILVGNLSGAEEERIGRVLAPYLKDPENACVISSDFCHWGHYFSYTPYSPDNNLGNIVHLRGTVPAKGPTILETIKLIDESAMDAVESGDHDAFLKSLEMTQNTVCGRHPIGVAMAAMEVLSKENNDPKSPRFKIVRYARSLPEVKKMNETSVSYVSAYAIL